MLNSDTSFHLLDLNLLRVFDALMTEGSVAGAAGRLSVTPSAVSHALGRLRTLFNDPLFTRASHGIRATPHASALGPRVQEGLRQLEIALTPAAFVPEETQHVFTVACSGYVAAVLLPGMIAALRARAPRAGLRVVSWSAGVFDRFKAGEIDLLLGDFTRVPEDYEFRQLFDDRLAWVMGRDYALRPGMAAASAALLDVARPSNHGESVIDSGFERRTLDECCGVIGNPFGHGADAAILDSLPYAPVVPLMAKRADLVALLPRRLAELFAIDLQLDLIEPAEEQALSIRTAAVWHRDDRMRAPAAWLRDLLLEVGEEIDRETVHREEIPGEKIVSGNFRSGKSAPRKFTPGKFTGEEPHALPPLRTRGMAIRA